MANEIFPNSSRSPANVQLGVPVTLTWAATATLGIAYREGRVIKPSGAVVELARVWYPDGPLGPQAFTDTTEAGTYRWISRYADMSVIGGSANGLTASYYNSTDPTNPAYFVFTRTDPNIDYFFPANTPPSPGIVSDHYSIKWQGKIIPRFSENYTFSTLSDDGVRVWVNGIKIIDNWTDHGATTDVAAPMFLSANTPYSIEVHFFNNFGPGLLHLYWQSFSQNYEVVPQSQLRNNGTGTLTYGTGYKDQELTFQVGGFSQATVNVSPLNPTVQVGAALTFTASGGTGGGLYNWGGQASGVGTTKQVTFGTVGTFQVTVYRAGDGTYNQSNTAVTTITVTKANQASLVATPANQTVPVGTVVTLTANGGSGTGQYVWGGAVSQTTSGNSITFTVPASGLSQITCQKLGDSTFNASNTVTFNVTGTKSSQVAVTISPTTKNVLPGTVVEFTASGGSGTGAFQWGGDASGSGSTKQVTFNTLGTRTVTVKRLGDNAYNDSNTATATITVQNHSITPNSSRSPASRPVGQPFTLTWNATATLGLAYREGTITQPDGSTVSLARVNSFEPGMLGPQSFLPGGGKGVYTWTSRYADQSINTGPPYTEGNGYDEQQLTFTVTGLAQSAVSISPSSQSVPIGTQINFAASGGSSSGEYEWGGDASGNGSTKQVTFNVAGTRTVTVKRLGDAIYNDSNTATATITVNKLTQDAVTISPNSIDVEPGTTVEFTAAGGSGTGDYEWGGDASGSGSTKQVTFNTGGTRTVTVRRLGDDTYATTGFVTATIRVAVHIITPNSSTSPSSPQYGNPVTLRWNATATLGIYFREGTIYKPDGTEISLARVYNNQPGMLGPQSFTDTAQRGTYTWVSRYADTSIVNPPLTYGTGFQDQTKTFFVNGLAQPTLSIQPTVINATVTDDVTYTAVGGAGTGIYSWLVTHTITGLTDNIETTEPYLTLHNIPIGNKTIKVTKLSDFTYNGSNQSNTAQLIVSLKPQNLVTIDPSAVSVEVGTTVTFNAIGGLGTGDYSWNVGGTGPTKQVTFTQAGSFQVKVKKLSDGVYAASSDAVATVVVVNKLPPTVSISANPTDGPAPFSTTVTWSASDAVAVSVSGPGLSSTASSGSQLITDLKTGIKTYTITATNSGGTTSASVQVTVDLQPVVTNGFTVHFTDQTVLRADSWLWDFGDGSSTTTIRNPTHTYSELGTYLVTLTVTCDGRTDVKQKLITIGCNQNDPLPFTPDWDALVNEETFLPFDDPRYVGTDFTSPLGPAASRQSGPANPNWTMCPDVDYCDGPDELDVPQEIRFRQRWKVRLINGLVTFGPVGLPLIPAPNDMFFNTSMANTTAITLSFNSASAPYFAYQVGTNQVRVHFRVNGVPLKVQFAGETPRLFSEVIINPISDLCDVVLFYVRDGKIYVRFQRDNFAIEYFVAEPTIYGEELAVFTKIDANRNAQRIYLYGKTIGGKRLLFRSGLYPAFPDADPIHVDIDPESTDQTITLDSGSYAYIETVEFTDQDITLSSVDYGRGAFEHGTHFVSIVDGTITPEHDKADQNVVLSEGIHARTDAANIGINEATLQEGSYAKIEDAGTNSATFIGGYEAVGSESARNIITLLDGTEARRDERIDQVVTIWNGTEADNTDRSVHVISLPTGTYAAGQESGSIRGSLDAVFHVYGTHAVTHQETLDQVRHVVGAFKVAGTNTLKSVDYRNRTFKSVHHVVFSSGVTKDRTDRAVHSLVLKDGKHPVAEAHNAWTSDTLTGGEYAFGLLTFDNTDSDHFDSTKFTWDLNVALDDPEIPPP
jgi:PKD repeat protein